MNNKDPDILDVYDRKGFLMYRVNTAKMKPIPGHPGYFASATGHVFTTGAGGQGLGSSHPRPMVEHAFRKGEGYYRSVYLTVRKEGKAKSKDTAVHRLVCRTFHGEPPPGKNQTRHLNGTALDNRASNLAWGDHRENYEDAVRHGTAVGLRKGQRHPASKLSDEDIPVIRGHLRCGCSLREVADHYGVTKECIRAIAHGETWGHVSGTEAPSDPLTINATRQRRGLMKEAA